MQNTENTTCKIDQGTLQGFVKDGYTAWLGVPYAAPPLGELRFRAPQPPAPWAGLREATLFAGPSLQSATEYDPAQGQEDCLYLNIYRPATEQPESSLPVMVWLHGGGFMNGSGNAFRGGYLAQTANAIVVTVNYRLGPLGWLALPSLAVESADGSAGNYGLRDSMSALSWVKRNIHAFGGDAARVTIFGQSAGGEQVLAMMASPLAAGLFDRAISMSAPAGLRFPSIQESAEKHAAFLDRLGCTDPATQLSTLRRLPAATILNAAGESWNLMKSGLPWTPTVDGVVLPDQWINQFRAGRFQRVPIIIGHTREEGRLFTAIYENVANRLMTEADATIAATTFLKNNAAAALAAYAGSSLPPGILAATAVGDGPFVAGLTCCREALAQHVPVYGYQTYDPHAPESHVNARYTPVRAGHDSDLSLLFQWDDFAGQRPNLSPAQQELSIAMGRYFGQFAGTGDPNGSDLPEWPSGSDLVQSLETSLTGGIRSTPGAMYAAEHQLAFWRTIIDVPNK